MTRNYCVGCGKAMFGREGREPVCISDCRGSAIVADEHVAIPGELVERLSIYAAENGVTAREVLIGIILQWIDA